MALHYPLIEAYSGEPGNEAITQTGYDQATIQQFMMHCQTCPLNINSRSHSYAPGHQVSRSLSFVKALSHYLFWGCQHVISNCTVHSVKLQSDLADCPPFM